MPNAYKDAPRWTIEKVSRDSHLRVKDLRRLAEATATWDENAQVFAGSELVKRADGYTHESHTLIAQTSTYA